MPARSCRDDIDVFLVWSVTTRGETLKLYSYFQASAAYRVRIALALKGIEAEQSAVDLLRREALSTFQSTVNPQGLVPAIDTGDHGLIVQSLAIIEYLEERYPEPPLLPRSIDAHAYVRAAAQMIACEIHPLANLRVLRYLKRELGLDQPAIDSWYRHWVEDGLGRLKVFVIAEKRHGTFLFGDGPTMADCLLVPQLHNARRLSCDLAAVPTLLEIDERCTVLDAFRRAHPSRQPDAGTP